MLVGILALNFLFKWKMDVRVEARKDEVDIRYLPSPRMASGLSIGFREAMADIFWIEALNYFGHNLAKAKRGTYEYLESYADLILQLDRLHKFFYEWCATVFIYRPIHIGAAEIAKSIRYGNLGIEELRNVHRFEASLIKKNAYNYAIETKEYSVASDYLTFLGRVSKDERNSLLISATYSDIGGNPVNARQLRDEYLTSIFLESDSVEQRREAIYILSSTGLNSGAIEFLRTARIHMEQDETIKKMMKNRFSQDQNFSDKVQAQQPIEVNLKIDRILKIPIEKTWIPPMLHLLTLL